MNYNDILKKVATFKGGTFGEVEFSRECKTLKNVTEKITKDTKMQVRFGVTYDNMGRVQEKRENGELPKENQGLAPNEVWEIYPYIIKNEVNGQRYLRIYPRIEDGKVSAKTTYRLNGQEIKKSEIENLLYSTEKKKSGNPSDCMKIKIENITKL